LNPVIVVRFVYAMKTPVADVRPGFEVQLREVLKVIAVKATNIRQLGKT
jgi:hypothetical protein